MDRNQKLAAWILAGLSLLPWTGAPPAAAQTCTASPSWVKHPSPPPIKKLDPGSLCQFYQFAWQAFLWLTQPDPDPKQGGALRFETYSQVQDVIPPNPAATACVDVDERNGRKRLFLPRAGKMQDATQMDAFEQAKSHGVLVDQNGNVTFYEAFLNHELVHFVDACQLTISGNCQNVPSAQSLRIPAGAIELKVSWRPISASDPNYGKSYVLKDVTYQDPQRNNRCVTGDMALVGFHLVYATPGHPELVWATFEHAANAPNGPCINGQSTLPAIWTYNNSQSTSCAGVNQWPTTTPPPPYPITQTFRNWAYGTLLPDTAGNIPTIQSLNSSVAGLLPASSVWQSYFLVGAVWTDKGALPPIPPFSVNSPTPNVQGSTVLANSTMETFEQLSNPPPQTTVDIADCFSCHTTIVPGGTTPPFTVSHAFGKSTSTCTWRNQQPRKACLATQKPIPGTLSSH